jgi:hypothetical protein
VTTPNSAVVPEADLPFPVTPHSVPGLSSCMEERRLLADHLPVSVGPCDVDALRLVEHAVALRRSVLLVPPDPLGPLVALIPAAAHLASLISGFRDFGVTSGSLHRIAVVTGDYHLRGVYRGLSIRPRPGTSGEPLRAVVPAGAIGAGGAIHILDDAGRGWSTVFIRSLADLRLVGAVDLVVVDLPVADPQRLAALDVPLVLVSRDPADPLTRRLADAMPSFAWDATDALDASNERLANRAREQIDIVSIAEPIVCENAELFWDDIGPLCRLGGHGLGPELSREAFALFHDLLGLALPLETYERSAGDSLAARVATLGRACQLLDRGELRELYVPMVEAELAALTDAVRGSEAKPKVLPRVLAEALDDHQDVLLIARTAGLARTYQQYLADSGLGQVRVASLGELVKVAPADVAVLTGMAPTWGRWVYRAGLAPRLRVLAYGRGDLPGERFDEAEIVRRAATEQREAETRLSGADRRVWSWTRLTTPASDLPAPDPVNATQLSLVRVTDAPAPPEVPTGLWADGRWLADLEPSAFPRGGGAGRDRLDRVVSGVRVDLADGSWVLLASDVPVSRWRPNSARLEGVNPAELSVGDQLVFLDEDAHKTLMAKVLEVAESVPALAVAGGWLTHWRSVLGGAYRGAGSYAALADRLAEHGCGVQAQTVRLWVIGVTLGPDDPEDVRRLGLLTNDPALLDAHQEVYRAMRTLRGAHVRLGRRLADLTRRLGPAAASGRLPGDEVVDEASGLTAADIEAAVTVAAVTEVTPMGDVPAVLTGRRTTREDIPA